MGMSLSKPFFKTILTQASTTSAGPSAAFSIPIADSYTWYLNVTTAQTTANYYFLTSVDGGTTYVNVPWVFAAVTTTTGCFVLNTRSGLGSGFDQTIATSGGAIPPTTAALSLQAIVDPSHMEFTWANSGTVGFTLYMACWTRAGGDLIE